MHKAAAFCLTLTAALAAAVTLLSAQTSSPLLLVALRLKTTMGALAFVDTASGKIVARVPTGQDPHGVTASADGRTAYVVNRTGPDGNTISVIDIAARKEVDRIQVGPGARLHDIQASGGMVYFTSQGYRAVGRYDTTRKTLAWFGVGEEGPHQLLVTKDGNTIYAANTDSHNVAVIEGVTGPNWKVSLIPVGGEGEGIDMSPDGKEIWLASGEKNGGVAIIDLATRKVQNIPLQTVHANRLQMSPDGKYVIVLDRQTGDSELIVLDRVSRKQVARMKPAPQPGQMIDLGDVVVAPDSSRAYVTVFNETVGGRNHVVAIDLKTLTIASRIETPIWADEMAWAHTN